MKEGEKGREKKQNEPEKTEREREMLLLLFHLLVYSSLSFPSIFHIHGTRGGEESSHRLYFEPLSGLRYCLSLNVFVCVHVCMNVPLMSV